MEMFRLFYLLATCTAFALADKDENDSDQAWKTIHYKVFATTGESRIPPEETLELLNKLSVLEAENKGPKAGIGSIDVKDLLFISELETSKCNADYFRNVNSLIYHESIFKVNLIPYLIHFKQRQLKMCLGKFASGVRSDSAHLSKLDRINLLAFREEVLKANHGKNIEEQLFYIQRQAVQTGAFEYFKIASTQDPKVFTSNKKGKELFKAEILRLIGKPCANIIKSFEESLDLFSALKKDTSLTKQLDGNTLKWLESAEICGSSYVQDLWALAKHIYEKLKSENPSHSKWFAFFKGRKQ